jgi:hypothetical protein
MVAWVVASIALVGRASVLAMVHLAHPQAGPLSYALVIIRLRFQRFLRTVPSLGVAYIQACTR